MILQLAKLATHALAFARRSGRTRATNGGGGDRSTCCCAVMATAGAGGGWNATGFEGSRRGPRIFLDRFIVSVVGARPWPREEKGRVPAPTTALPGADTVWFRSISRRKRCFGGDVAVVAVRLYTTLYTPLKMTFVGVVLLSAASVDG